MRGINRFRFFSGERLRNTHGGSWDPIFRSFRLNTLFDGRIFLNFQSRNICLLWWSDLRSLAQKLLLLIWHESVFHLDNITRTILSLLNSWVEWYKTAWTTRWKNGSLILLHNLIIVGSFQFEFSRGGRKLIFVLRNQILNFSAIIVYKLLLIIFFCICLIRLLYWSCWGPKLPLLKYWHDIAYIVLRLYITNYFSLFITVIEFSPDSWASLVIRQLGLGLSLSLISRRIFCRQNSTTGCGCLKLVACKHVLVTLNVSCVQLFSHCVWRKLTLTLLS